MWLADPHAVPDDGIQINKDLVAQECVNFGFSAAMPTHQPPQRGYLVIGVVINM